MYYYNGKLIFLFPDNIKRFILENPDLPREFYGACYEQVMKPIMKDFDLPESQQEWDSMVYR